MKLWLILWQLGQVGATWGPLPYGMSECLSRADALVAEIDEKAALKPEVGVKPGDFAAECRFTDTRLELGARR